jgi:hypothetical protein
MSKQGDRFILPSRIAKRLECHPSSVPRIFANDDGPKPVRIGCRNKYRASEVGEYYKKKGIV